jgi:hypothetical protein
MANIEANLKEIKKSIPDYVTLVAAAKGRTAEEIKEAIDAGIEIIGENYVQEAEKVMDALGNQAKWHMLGHLQRNKVKKAVPLFDMVETVDSLRLAEAMDKQCTAIDKTMPVLVEINICTSGAAFRLLWKPHWYVDNIGFEWTEERRDIYRHAFEAVGYAYNFITKEEGRDNEAYFRNRIIASLRTGHPVIAQGIVGPPEWCIITGYDEHGNVLNLSVDFTSK